MPRILHIRDGVYNLKGFLMLVSDEDYERCAAHRWSRVGSGYISTSIHGRTISIHRFIMGEPAGLVVDHINRIPADNRRSNLRAVTARENMRNRSPYRHKKCPDNVPGPAWERSEHLAALSENNSIIWALYLANV